MSTTNSLDMTIKKEKKKRGESSIERYLVGTIFLLPRSIGKWPFLSYLKYCFYNKIKSIFTFKET